MEFLKNILSSLTALVLFALLVSSILLIVLFYTSSESETNDYSILHIKIDDNLVDRQNSSDISLVKSSYCSSSLSEIQYAINNAEKDSMIKGVFLEIGDLSGSLANVSSLKRTIESFKNTGRRVTVYSDGLSQIAYYLASSGDSIYVSNLSNIEWKGLGAQLMYFKTMLDRIGIQAQPIRAGKYKSAVEPFILDSMSSQNKFQLSEMLNDIWSNILMDVSKERGVSIDELNRVADDLGFLNPYEALQIGLVDGIKFEDEVLLSLDEMAGGKAVLIKTQDYNKKNKIFSKNKSKIVVVNADGSIVDSNSDSDISSVRYCKIFDDILCDENVKGVVLRINSPGGSALASEKLWRKLKLIGEKLPLIVSMGNYAASGGYYIACAADTIIAEKNTITGSIGVFGLLFNASRLTEKIGVKVEKVKTNQMSDFPSFDRSLSDKEKNRISKGINSVYTLFKLRVQRGRSLTEAQVDQLAEGRVWTGKQALNLGLIDKLGGLEDALEIAANSANIEKFKIIHLPEEKSPIEAVLQKFSQQTQLNFPQPFSQYNYMIQNPDFFGSFSKPQARLPFVIKID